MRNFRIKSIITAAVAVFVVSIVVGCPPPVEGGPEAEFRVDMTSGQAPLTVQFTDLSTPGDSPITSWTWLFGDGATSAEQDPSHTYTTAGTYSVSLTAKNSIGEDTELKLAYISVDDGSEGEGEGEGEGGPFDKETVMLPGGVPLVMVWIPGGTFQMGRSPDEQDSYSDEGPRHAVTVPGFWMAKYELTKAQWEAVMGTTPWSGGSLVLDDPDSPAVYVSWNDAQSFITALNGLTGKTFRLPSEAEWEYACRAGTTTRFYWGDDPSYTAIDDYAWWDGNAYDVNERYAHVVGQLLPNAFGLYDMSGNVWEWCQDWYHLSYTGAPADGSAWESPTGSSRVFRGGGWFFHGIRCRSAHRTGIGPSGQGAGLGFRLVK